MSFSLTNKVRIVTAASLFDGHDAAINIMRRILQSKGAEIIHLGHNRSVHEIVECAIEEDVQAIAITSYQGGHLEFFKYMKNLLDENGCSHIKIFGGGGGTILPTEIEALYSYGISRIYSPDDGRKMGLEGMIEDLLMQADFSVTDLAITGELTLQETHDVRKIARAISIVENNGILPDFLSRPIPQSSCETQPILGITGTGGAGKSSVTDEIVRRFLQQYPDKTVAVISVDPSKKKTGGALLGDRIRMNAISSPRVYMRSLATRESDRALSKYVQQALDICRAAGYNLIILESAGVGQSDASILDFVDASMYVMTPEYGAPSQLEKINMLDYADLICLNKFDKPGALDAIHDIRKQYKRNHNLWTVKDEELPVIGTIAAQFNDSGVNALFNKLIEVLAAKTGVKFQQDEAHQAKIKSTPGPATIIPAKRVRYLSEIAETIKDYNNWVNEQAAVATKLYQLDGAIKIFENESSGKKI